ncbi:MAG: GH109 [uncultured Thermomicrobiales bacterium]|uniref:GH109 n=1 Tax=uncultured Thermomicrobiales bacterium TaxID=1645740 RepID=A0A6J4V820_9BACT|nr:MAG: GH109 [uncultured Thermomicrobiales bacterium]
MGWGERRDGPGGQNAGDTPRAPELTADGVPVASGEATRAESAAGAPPAEGAERPVDGDGSGKPAGENTDAADPPEPPLRVAVIGTGFGAAVHIPALQALPETEVVAVCARRQERALAVAAQYRIPLAATDYRALMREEDIDAVVIATPPYLHHQMTLAAIDAGKHVLCEKPMARNLAEARDMVKMARGAGVVAMVNHELRFQPVRARIKELIDEGYLGQPQAATLTAFRSSLADPNGRPFGWLMERDKAGGMLGATGSHHVDALRWWLGEVKGVAGATATMVRRRRLPDGVGMASVDADDNFAFVLRFASGALGTVHVTATAAVDSGEEILLAGSEGMLMAHGDGALYGARRGGGLEELAVPDAADDGDDLPDFDHPLVRPTARLMRRWVAAIRAGEPSPSPSFADGEKVQEVLDGVARSSQQGRWIDTSGTRWPVSA